MILLDRNPVAANECSATDSLDDTDPNKSVAARILVLLRFVLLLLCFLPIACGGSKVKVYPAHGEVFFNEEPAKGAAVHLHPVDKKECSPAFGTVDEDGSFRLSTFGNYDGAMQGDYVVTISWRDEKQVDGESITGPDRLGDLFSNPKTSKLKATIEEGDNELTRFSLKK